LFPQNVTRLRRYLLVSALLPVLVALAACGSGGSGPTLTTSPGGSEFRALTRLFKAGPRITRSARSVSFRSFPRQRQTSAETGSSVTVSPSVPGESPPDISGDHFGEFACPSGTPLSYLVGLRYSDAAETEVEAEYHSCDTARTKEGYWGATTELEKELNSLLAGWVPFRHRSKPPFFTSP
jgi:hypothetical protein